jgi:TfoX/Sxy family transcriptional regulator of competence genes
VTDKRMFGGCAFLVNGNMAVSSSEQGRLMARVDPAQTASLVRRSIAQRKVMGARDGLLAAP